MHRWIDTALFRAWRLTAIGVETVRAACEPAGRPF